MNEPDQPPPTDYEPSDSPIRYDISATESWQDYEKALYQAYVNGRNMAKADKPAAESEEFEKWSAERIERTRKRILRHKQFPIRLATAWCRAMGGDHSKRLKRLMESYYKAHMTWKKSRDRK